MNMRTIIRVTTCVAIVAACGMYSSRIPAIAALRVLPVDPPAHQQQGNAASATKDNSGASGDQITKPAGAKGSTLIGCLSGPSKDGKYTLRSMTYREGVQVLGPEDLKDDSGAKVKLTGKWEAPQQQDGSAKLRRFQVTDIEVMAKTCSAPSETTPQSKTKRQKATTYNAPSGESSK